MSTTNDSHDSTVIPDTLRGMTDWEEAVDLENQIQEPDVYIGEDAVVMYAPDTVDTFGMMERSEYVPAKGWSYSFADPTSDGGNLSASESDGVKQVVSFTGPPDPHYLDADRVETLADALGTTPADLLDTAEVNPNYHVFPVVFPTDDGWVGIAPYSVTPNETTDDAR